MTAVATIAYEWPMFSGASGSGRLRAITAVIALYALVLQAVLGGMLPAHAAGLDGILCTGLSESAPAADQGAPALPHKHADCCTAAHAPASAEPTRAAPLPVTWSARPVLRIRWEAAQEGRPRAPPGLIAQSRGPPEV